MKSLKNSLSFKVPADSAWFSQALLSWFAKEGRHDLPWQHPRTPYTVWLSEVMLQQTQVTTVKDYFARFIARFPTVQDLASADIDDVLGLWAGLGYYARARNLHKAAKIMAEAQPNTLEGFEALPGVGRSTAGAIMAQAFDYPASILDGNAKRVLARFVAENDKKILWAVSDFYTSKSHPCDYTQAIMDLGANICKRTPDCERCPLNEKCRAYQAGSVQDFPAKAAKKVKPVRQTNFLLVRSAKGFAFYKRPSQGIWGGLWSLPEGEPIGRKIGAGRHTFTHFHLDYQVYLAEGLAEPSWVWYKEPPSGIPRVIEKVFDEYSLLPEAEKRSAGTGSSAHSWPSGREDIKQH